MIVFQVPHSVQMIMAGEKLPSLCGMIPAIEMFMSGWDDLCQKEQHLKLFIQPGLEYAVKYYRAIDKTSSYAIAMCKYYLGAAVPSPDANILCRCQF